jgi:hypothetical protein
MEVSLAIPSSINIPDVWINLFIVAILAFIGMKLKDVIIID